MSDFIQCSIFLENYTLIYKKKYSNGSVQPILSIFFLFEMSLNFLRNIGYFGENKKVKKKEEKC